MKILGLQNCAAEGFGRYERLFAERGAPLTVVHPYRGEEIPDHHGFGAILVGGTPISAWKIADHPFLQVESQFLSQAIREGVPCVGICFGAQLLAGLLGATVTRAHDTEIGVYEVRTTAAGRADPLLLGFEDHFPVFHWHSDTFTIPPGGELLVIGDPCTNQMFRHGSVIGMQFHLEIELADARVWATAYEDELEDFGKTQSELTDDLAPHVSRMTELSDQFVINLLAAVR